MEGAPPVGDRRRHTVEDPALFGHIAENALAATGARMVALVLADPDGQHGRVVAHAGLFASTVRAAIEAAQRLIPGFDPTRITLRLGANPRTREVYQSGVSASAPFAEVATGNADNRLIRIAMDIAGLRWSHVYPLPVGGRVAGTLSFHCAAELPAAMRDVCAAFARQAALTLENAALAAAERRRASLAERLAQALVHVATAPDLEGALGELLRCAVGLVDARRGSAVLYDNAGTCQMKARMTGPEAQPQVRPPQDEEAGAFKRRVMAERRALVIRDFAAEHPECRSWTRHGMRSTVYAPIQAGTRAIGAFHVDHPEPAFFAEADASIALALGAQAGVVVERARAEERCRAEHDARARLDGALLVARTTAHEINNALAPVVGFAELLSVEPDLDARTRRYAQDIFAGAEEVAERVKRLQGIVRLETSETASVQGLPVLDVERSAAPERDGPGRDSTVL